MAKRKITKGQSTIYKTYVHKTENWVTRTPQGVSSSAPEG